MDEFLYSPIGDSAPRRRQPVRVEWLDVLLTMAWFLIGASPMLVVVACSVWAA